MSALPLIILIDLHLKKLFIIECYQKNPLATDYGPMTAMKQ